MKVHSTSIDHTIQTGYLNSKIMTLTPAEEPKSLVQQLADLIDAYASAKMTGNETLVKIAVGPLQQ